MLAGQHRVEPFLHKLLTGPGDGREAGVERLRDLAVAPGFAGVTCVGLQQDARLGQPLRGMFAAADRAIELLPLFGAELHHIFLSGDLFGSHESTPSFRYGDIESDILLRVNDGGH